LHASAIIARPLRRRAVGAIIGAQLGALESRHRNEPGRLNASGIGVENGGIIASSYSARSRSPNPGGTKWAVPGSAASCDAGRPACSGGGGGRCALAGREGRRDLRRGDSGSCSLRRVDVHVTMIASRAPDIPSLRSSDTGVLDVDRGPPRWGAGPDRRLPAWRCPCALTLARRLTSRRPERRPRDAAPSPCAGRSPPRWAFEQSPW
jgi:hypothetical protein